MPSVDLKSLSESFPNAGRLNAIFLRTAKRGDIRRVDQTEVIMGRGLAGDHRSQRDGRNRRLVTLIQAEHIPVIAALAKQPDLDPADLRRNLLVSGINLIAAKSLFPKQRLVISIGDQVELEINDDCDPCSRMEALLGPGGYNAMRGHGGVIAHVVSGGIIAIGDAVRCRAV